MITNKIFLALALAVVLLGLVSAAETSYCCEKTNSGAWCQNAPQDQCNSSFAISPTSCESTGYCREGCCFNRNTGTCAKNSPEKICTNDGGIWTSEKTCSISQCSLGCCLIGDQAAFVSRTRCGHLASAYGLNVNYRSDISSEVACIATATADVEGACVWKEGFDNKCERTTKAKCSELSSSRNSTFYDGLLCTNSALNTTCDPSEKTTCVEGKDGVYFLDTCGNLANIYDSSKAKDETSDYWKEIIDPLFSCTLDLGSLGSQSNCGNCNYYDGSTCKKFERTSDIYAPIYGDYICRDLSCDYDTDGIGGIDAINEHYQHGETWCAQSKGSSEIIFGEESTPDSSEENVPGTRYFRLVCYNGEVTVEPCADFRQEVCMEQKVSTPTIPKGTFSNANCIVNKWQDCLAQTDEKDCINTDMRDCSWISVDGHGKCVPRYAPGLSFWGENADAMTQCSTGNAKCKVEYTKSIEREGGNTLGLKTLKKTFEDMEWRITDNERCDPTEGGGAYTNWREDLNNYCVSLGDCGFSNNYMEQKGYSNWEDIITYTSKMDEEEMAEKSE